MATHHLPQHRTALKYAASPRCHLIFLVLLTCAFTLGLRGILSSAAAIPKPDPPVLPAPTITRTPPQHASALCRAVRRGRHHIPSCFKQQPSRVYPLLITSMGRSGTRFMSKVFAGLGYNVTHDNSREIGTHGAVSWPLAAQDPQPSWASKANPHDRFALLIHQVRDPLTSIPSRAALIHPVIDGFVAHHTPDLNASRMPREFRENSVAVAMLHYITWHTLIDSQAPEITFQLEQVDARRLRDILARSGLLAVRNSSLDQIERVLSSLDTQTNKHHVRHHEDVSWRDLFAVHAGLANATMQLASTYGYTYEEQPNDMPPPSDLDRIFPYPSPPSPQPQANG